MEFINHWLYSILDERRRQKATSCMKKEQVIFLQQPLFFIPLQGDISKQVASQQRRTSWDFWWSQLTQQFIWPVSQLSKTRLSANTWESLPGPDEQPQWPGNWRKSNTQQLVIHTTLFKWPIGTTIFWPLLHVCTYVQVHEGYLCGPQIALYFLA